MVDIIVEAVQLDKQEQKLRKPKYIAREKKIIQISKYNSALKDLISKVLGKMGHSFEQNFKLSKEMTL